MRYSKLLGIASLALLFISNLSFAQQKSGYYINWDINHTETSVIPSIPITAEEAKTVNCYYVEFDDENRLKSVKFFFSGLASEFSNYGAHELIREYHKGYFIEKYKNADGISASGSGGINKKKFILNENGHWTTKENYLNEKLLPEGVAYSKVERKVNGDIIKEVQFSAEGDTIPDGNGFKVVYFSYNQDKLTQYRQNRNQKGEVVNGTNGYATVIFQFDHNGNFFEEQFLDEHDDLFLHPAFDLAKINWREFNRYGKPSKIYYMDEYGYPNINKAYGVIKYRPNMTRESITYFDRMGEPTTDINGIAKSVYNYGPTGQFMGRINYDLANQKLLPQP